MTDTQTDDSCQLYAQSLGEVTSLLVGKIHAVELQLTGSLLKHVNLTRENISTFSLKLL